MQMGVLSQSHHFMAILQKTFAGTALLEKKYYPASVCPQPPHRSTSARKKTGDSTSTTAEVFGGPRTTKTMVKIWSTRFTGAGGEGAPSRDELQELRRRVTVDY